MKPERWQQIKILLQSALEREPDQRPAFLAAACAGDDSLQKEVEAYIISYNHAGAFIEDPAFEVMADSLAENKTESLIGQSLGHYTIREQLGAGGMGEVYLAEDTRLGRKVALKLLPPFFTTDDERLRRFQQEARAASALNHPNIVTIYEIGQFDSHHFIAGEFVEGDTLRQRMMRTPMPIAECLGIATQIASALTAAHQNGIVHRDIKPENIMLRADGIVKVLDFGLAKLIASQSGDSEASTIFRTQPGVIMGTPHYMSPEQARGLNVDARTDTWGLGVLLYEMVGGRVPFAGETSSDVIVSILEKEPPPLARFMPETPEVLQWIITKALRKQIDHRYQAAKELLADLQNLKHRLEFENEVKRWEGSEQAITKTAKDSSALPIRASGERGPLDSVAILPLANNLPDPSMEYFSDGITESMINALSRLPELRVMAWSTVSRYKGKDIDPRDAGRELGVRAVLTGRVMQFGERLIIKTELVDATDGSHLSGESYSCKPSDILEVEAEISSAISEKLLLRLTGEERARLTKRHTDDVEAYHAYLMGRYCWNKRTDEGVRKAIEHFKRAIDIDPSYALAYAGLSDSYIVLGGTGIATLSPEDAVPKARKAASRALEIDDTLAEAHASLGYCLANYDWDWPAAEREFKLAIERRPDYPTAHHWYGFIYLVATGFLDEAIKEQRRALALDPLSLVINTNLGLLLYLARRYDEAIDQFQKTLEMDQSFFYTHFQLALAYEQKGMYGEAVAGFQKAIALSGTSALPLALLGHAYAVSGKRNEALKVLGELSELSGRRYVSAYRVAAIYVGLGDTEQAFQWLNQAYEERDGWLIYLKSDPVFDRLRSDERFTTLLRRIGLTRDSKPAEAFSSTSSLASLSRASVPSRSRPSRKGITSLAILPLVNTSADPSMEYFSDGVTESIINALSQLPRLRVVARSTVFRYKGLEVDPQEVGRQLGARAVLTGRVRQVGDGLMIAAELIDVTNDSQLWGEHYNRKLSDIFEVQEEIAKEISEKLRLKLTGEDKKRLAKRYTANPEAYQLYLRGRHFWYKRTEEALRKSIEYFNQAIAEDPAYAAAYDGLSDSYALLALRGIIPPREGLLKAKAAARKALQIDDTLGEAYASLAHVRLHDWDWSGLEEEFKRALELNPGHAIAYHWYSEYLMAMGRLDESIAIIKQGQETDPLSPVICGTLGFAFFFARKYDQAIEQFRKALELDSNHFLSHYRLGHIYSLRGSHQEAIEEAQKSVALSGRSTETLAGLAQAYAAAGIREEMQKILDELNERSQEHYVSPYYVAKIYAALGDKEQALQWLEKGYEERNPDFIELKVEPALDVLRTDARFRDLLRRVGLAPAESFPAAHSTAVPKLPSRKTVSRRGIKSLAVMPFVNASADPNMDYLSDGITESIINTLSQLPKFRVVARSTVFRYKGKEVDPREVGRVLQVQAVLTGRVRQVGDSLNIGAELINVDSDSQLWGESYNRRLADIFEVQAEIAREIAETLRLRLSGADKGRLTRSYTQNAEAYQLYLKGRYHWNQRTIERLQKGLECFQQAIAIDPNYALAYAGISDCYAFRGDVGLAAVSSKDAFAMAKQTALRALEIDHTLAEGYASLAHANMHCFEWEGAEAAFKSAIKFNPNHPQAHQWYAFYLLFNAQPDGAIAEAKRALELDPLSLTAHGDLGQMFHYTRQYDRAIDVYQKTLDLEPNRHRVYLWLGWVFEQQREYQDAIGAFEKALSEDNTEPLASLGCVYALSGRTAEAHKVLKQLNELSASRYVSPYHMSLLFLSLGDEEIAFEWLEKAYEQRAEWMIYLSVDPRFDRLRADSRFMDVLERVGFRTTQKRAT